MSDAASPAGWDALRAVVRAQQPLLRAPRPGEPGLCRVCRGPSAGRGARCFQCDLHSQCAQGSLADLVVPVAFAIKGGAHARHLWQYKSARPGARAGEAAAKLRALLLVFLRDHGACLWRTASASCPRAGAGPTHLAVVPTGRGRPGPHPLRALVDPYTRRPWAELSARPGGLQVRDLDPDRFAVAPVRGARVLLLDDTWTTGSSAQSAAMALRQAGARQVVTVILGRHVGPGWAGPGAAPFRPDSCAVHGAARSPADLRLEQ
ncbi:MAG TPA: phosphoribosyltransferase [Streptosporangiaceae bacterium]